MALWVRSAEPTELRAGATEEDVQKVIRAAYKQQAGFGQHPRTGQPKISQCRSYRL